jgi:hypothetical protein
MKGRVCNPRPLGRRIESVDIGSLRTLGDTARRVAESAEEGWSAKDEIFYGRIAEFEVLVGEEISQLRESGQLVGVSGGELRDRGKAKQGFSVSLWDGLSIRSRSISEMDRDRALRLR